MITEISKQISHFLYQKKVIEKDMIEVHQYGFETIFSTLLGFFINLVIGIVFRMTLLSLVYYFVFCTIRQFTGGYHADTYLKCNLTFAATTIFIFGMARMADICNVYSMVFHMLLIIFSVAVIWWKAPVENENKPLSEDQKLRNHRLSVITVTGLAILSIFLHKESILISTLITFTLFIIAVMIVIEIPKEGEEL